MAHLSCIGVFPAALILLFFCQGGRGAMFTLVNKCNQTVWPGILGSPKIDTTGFELPRGSSRSFQAPTGWSGRFWGRTGCRFDDSGSGSCATADCGSGQIECGGGGATPPATLAEFTLGTGSQDFYDVSLVDGYNLPVTVDASGGSGPCASTGCAEDLNQKCPAELRTENGRACRSACDAFKTPQYCCAGAYASPSLCAPSIYSQLFKSACPKSYSYAYDDATSTFTCTAANYIITFCPSSAPKSLGSEGTTTEPGSGMEAEPEPGAEEEPESGTEGEPGSGSMQSAMLADGSWLADLATGGSNRLDHSRGGVQFMAFNIVIVFLHRLLQS
nr:Thaumatin-like protein 1 [Ipomoea batatas]